MIPYTNRNPEEAKAFYDANGNLIPAVAALNNANLPADFNYNPSGVTSIRKGPGKAIITGPEGPVEPPPVEPPPIEPPPPPPDDPHISDNRPDIGNPSDIWPNDPWDQYSSWTPDEAFNAKYGKNTYNVTTDRWAKVTDDPAAAWAKQNWWMNPDWNGEYLYRPDVGFQPYADIAAKYRAAGGPVDWNTFQSWGLQNNTTFPGWGDGSGGAQATTTGASPGAVDSTWYDALIKSLTGSQPTTPTSGTFGDNLENFGYLGPMGINEYEQQALNLIAGQNQPGGNATSTLQPGFDYYQAVLSGALAPQNSLYQNAVIDATRNAGWKNVSDASRYLAQNFSDRGGYFGGGHAVSQSRLWNDAINNWDKQAAELNLAGYNTDINQRMTAAQNLVPMAQTQNTIANDVLGNTFAGGNLVTQREALNRADLQAAQQRAYEDWTRANQEKMIPYNMAMSLLGMNQFENIANPQQFTPASPWYGVLGSLLGGAGQVGGALIGK